MDAPSKAGVLDRTVVRRVEVDAVSFAGNRDRPLLELAPRGVDFIDVGRAFQAIDGHSFDRAHLEITMEGVCALHILGARIVRSEFDPELWTGRDADLQGKG